MKRLGLLCAFMAGVMGLGAGCANVNGRWVPLDQAKKEQLAAAAANGPEQPEIETKISEPIMVEAEPAPESVATPQETTARITQFATRLNAKHPQPIAELEELEEPKPATEPVAADEPGGLASTTANMALEVPDPSEEAARERAARKPVEATEVPRIEAVAIVTAQPETDDAAESKTLSANEPLDATEVRGEYSIHKYTTMLEEALQKNPSDVNLQWLLSTTRLVLGEDQKAATISSEIAREPAELLRDTIRFFTDVRQLLVDPSQPADATLQSLEALRTKLRERAELVIPVVALCTRVRTFGVYDEMPSNQFLPHRANRTVVYTEVKNFVSAPQNDGQFETLLAGRLELLTKDGRVVWHHEDESIKEVSRQRREDFFLAQLVTLPAELGPGDYVLKVMIQDLLGGKANEAHVNISIGDQQPMASASR